MTETADKRKTASRAERIGSAVFGVFLVAIAVWIAVMAAPFTSIGEPIAALVIGALGAEALVGAITGRRSLASRIGPLP